MQTVSENYTPYSDVRKLGVSVRFGVFDAEAQRLSVAESSYSAPMSQIDQVKTNGRSTRKINTLEDGAWLLDGDGQLMPSSVSGMYTGWWSSEVSGDNAAFSTPPVFRFTFSDNVSCIGFTLNFNPLFPWSIPTSVKISTYGSSDTLIEEQTFANDELMLVAEMPSVNIRRVDFTFLSTWMPRQRIKLDGVGFGIAKKYGDDDISNLSFVAEASPDMSALPASALQFTVNNIDKKYNMTNPDSIYRFLHDDQKIHCDIIVNGEAVELCDYQYIESNSSDEGTTAVITAGTWAYQLDDCRYNVGMSGTFSFGDAITSIKTESALDFGVDISNSILSRTVSKAIPRNTKCRNALALFAQAARCVVYFDKKNVLRAVDLDLTGTAVDTMDEDNMSRVPQLNLTKRINRAILTVRDDYAETEHSYTSTHTETGEGIRSKSYDNPAVYSGSNTALWLRQINERRIHYTVNMRGNPALDIGDLVNVVNAYGETDKGNVIKNTISYKTGMTQTLELLGGKWSDL